MVVGLIRAVSAVVGLFGLWTLTVGAQVFPMTGMPPFLVTNSSTFADLATPADGTAKYCTDCTAGTNPCTDGGTGAWAFRQAGTWICIDKSGAGGETDPVFTASEAAMFVVGDKTKLDGIAAGAEVNVNADWNAVAGDSLILNKPSLVQLHDQSHEVTSTTNHLFPGGTTFLRADGTFAEVSGSGASWGDITGTLSAQTDLQTALDGKAASGHTHSGVYEPANANIQTHVGSAHAPADAQKNADITKAEIEAKLTGEISSHSHAGGGGSPWVFIGATTGDISTGANQTPVALTGLVFTYQASSVYLIEFAGATQAAATTTGQGFALDVSGAVTRVGTVGGHQLANTGTWTGFQSIADNTRTGTTSARPTVSVDTAVHGMGYLVTGSGQTGTAQLMLVSEVNAVCTAMAGFIMRVTKVS